MSTVENHYGDCITTFSCDILENMFRLLFVRSDLKNHSNGEIDVGQKHTTTAVGGTGMTSGVKTNLQGTVTTIRGKLYRRNRHFCLLQAEAGSVLVPKRRIYSVGK